MPQAAYFVAGRAYRGNAHVKDYQVRPAGDAALLTFEGEVPGSPGWKTGLSHSVRIDANGRCTSMSGDQHYFSMVRKALAGVIRDARREKSRPSN